MSKTKRLVRRPVFLLPLAILFVAGGLAFQTPTASANEEKKAEGQHEKAVVPSAETMPHSDVRAGSSSGQNNLHTQVRGTVEGSANPGRELYVQGCSTCHGVNGEGTEVAPSLIGVGEAAVDFYVGTGRMPLNNPVKQAPRRTPIYNEEQIGQLAKYVASFGEGPEIPHINPERGDLVEGNILYTNNCAACHNSNGSGGALGRDYYAPNLFDATPLEVAEAVRIGPGAMPVFRESSLSDEQMDSLLLYVEHLKNADNPGGLSLGRIGPVSEGFVAWIVGLGALLGVARWIGTRE